MKGQEVLTRLYEIRDKIVQEARKRPSFANVVQRVQLEIEFERLQTKFSQDLKKEKKKSLKYQTLLNQKPEQLLQQQKKVKQLRDKLQILKSQQHFKQESSQQQDLKAQLSALDESLLAVFKNYQIAQRKSKRLQRQNDRLLNTNESLSNAGSVHSMNEQHFAFSKKANRTMENQAYLTSRTHKIQWGFDNSVHSSHSKMSANHEF